MCAGNRTGNTVVYHLSGTRLQLPVASVIFCFSCFAPVHCVILQGRIFFVKKIGVLILSLVGSGSVNLNPGDNHGKLYLLAK